MDQQIATLLKATKKEGPKLNNATLPIRNAILKDLAQLLLQNEIEIISANYKDLTNYQPEDPLYDRLLLTSDRIKNMAQDLENIICLADPLNQTLEKRTLKNGLELKKDTVPLGIIGIIYESRPNVTIDTAALCIKSGNCVVLRGGSDSYNSNQLLVKLIKSALTKNNIPAECVQLLPTDRALVKDFLQASNYIDVIIPRGGKKLIERVRNESSVPVIETGAGVVHTYVDETADPEIAAQIVFNAKTQRPSVCNALDTLLVNTKISEALFKELCPLLANKKVEIRADEPAWKILNKHYPADALKKATKNDFGTEFLSQKLAIKSIDNLEEAIDHISKYSSKHSEAIISNNKNSQERFLQEIDAAAVYVNTSTRFTDGSVFELGAEIGISTQKLHARGPMGLNELTSYKWKIIGTGQVRN